MKQILLLLVSVLGSTAWLVRLAPAPKNILFIIADDLSPTLGCYGDRNAGGAAYRPSVAPTPTIDRLARQGVLFERAFCAAPSCSPSRASILTGHYPHQLAEGTNLWGTLPNRFPNVVNLLEAAGYRVGLTGKGWGPGDAKVGGYARNPAGPSFTSFAEFMQNQPAERPFCFWLGSTDPHRPYDAKLKKSTTLRPQYLNVPAFLPDTPEVREDLLDYYAEVARFEQTVAEAINLLEKQGQLANTLVVITSDNGMPFPRAKANLYDAGTRIPLILHGGPFAGGKRVGTLVSQIHLAPTFLTWAGLPVATGMQGESLMRYVTGTPPADQPVFVERERHAQVRTGNLGYPARAIRTAQYLYVQNLKPDRWPAGDPREVFAVGAYGDIDNGPSKQVLMTQRDKAAYRTLAALALDKRPAEELYDLPRDPSQLRNVADDPAYQSAKETLRGQLQTWRQRTGDPRLSTAGDVIDTYPYYGNNAAKEPR